MAITITGASGNTVTLQSGSGNAATDAAATAAVIDAGIASGAMKVSPLESNPSFSSGETGVATVDTAGTYNVNSDIDYVVIGDGLTGNVTLNGQDSSSQAQTILGGRSSGLTYNAGNSLADGTNPNVLINTVGNLDFNGRDKTGNWKITSGAGDDHIISSSGNSTIDAGTGKNTIELVGNGNSNVTSRGQDTITSSLNNQTVYVLGGSSSVTLGSRSIVVDSSRNNTFSLGGNSTLNAGTNGTVSFNGGGDGSSFQNGTNNTVTASGDGTVLRVSLGNGNNYNVDGQLNFLNGYGNTQATVTGSINGFGGNRLNMTLNVTGDNAGYFVGGNGNETLDASSSSGALQIYADTITGHTTAFVAKGGSGNDTLAAGVSDSTLSGGSGDNLFMFAKGATEGGSGTTVIQDFSASAGNRIGLFNYGLDENQLTSLLQNSQNDSNGNAVLNIDTHKIVVEGVSIDSLKNNHQLVVSNSTPAA